MIILRRDRGCRQGEKVRLKHQFLSQCRFGHHHLKSFTAFLRLNFRLIRFMVSDKNNPMVRGIPIGIFHEAIGSHVPIQHVNLHFRV